MRTPTTDIRRRVQARLLRWFYRHQRDLPWRRNRDPYRIWVSEVMLQQTQAAVVVPFFMRFLQAFPDVQRLANARLEDVMRIWEGLGYYRRARNLHESAQRIVADHFGKFPQDADALERLPGIGRYMVGAILSQAFERRLPIVEANGRRVWCRLFGRADDTSRGPGLRWLWRTAEAMLPLRNIGAFNQAVMELGALVCTPKSPHCEQCPLAEDCVARRCNRVGHIPQPPRKSTQVHVIETAVVVKRGSRVLVVQRPDVGSWNNLWEFPHRPLEIGESPRSAVPRLVCELSGIVVEAHEEFAQVRHSVTHHRIVILGWTARYCSGRFKSLFYRQARWVTLAELTRIPVSRPQRRLAQMFES